MKIEKIEFMATLKQSGAAITIDKDNQSKVTFEIPQSYLSEVVKLSLVHDKVLKITVVADSKGGQYGTQADGGG